MKAEVESVLAKIDAGDIPVINVFNKIDLTGDAPAVKKDGQGITNRVWLSAQTGTGIPALLKGVAEFIGREYQFYYLNLKPEAGELRSKLFQKCEVLSENVDDAGTITLKVKMEEATMGWLKSQARFKGLWQEIPGKYPGKLPDAI